MRADGSRSALEKAMSQSRCGGRLVKLESRPLGPRARRTKAAHARARVLIHSHTSHAHMDAFVLLQTTASGASYTRCAPARRSHTRVASPDRFHGERPWLRTGRCRAPRRSPVQRGARVCGRSDCCAAGNGQRACARPP
eukprot:6326052-Prymnesium_polylepis.1